MEFLFILFSIQLRHMILFIQAWTPHQTPSLRIIWRFQISFTADCCVIEKLIFLSFSFATSFFLNLFYNCWFHSISKGINIFLVTSSNCKNMYFVSSRRVQFALLVKAVPSLKLLTMVIFNLRR